MVRIAVVGLGKMGLSHLSMIRAHPSVTVAAVCDATGFVVDVLGKYTGVKTFTDYDRMLAETELDAVIIATPTDSHAPLALKALERGLHVFVEKPFCLTVADGEKMTAMAAERGVVNQVGYHNRFVGAFGEAKRLIDAGALGEITQVHAEAYGPVVLKPKGGTWRQRREAGGGCLYDYAAHPLNLLNWYFGMPESVGGSVLNSVFSAETDDEVSATLYFGGGLNAQLTVNWSDESYRKMTTGITVRGTNGRIRVDRQEIQVYLRDGSLAPEGYKQGWNVHYTTELTEPVWFYVRGEEYSAQLDHFVQCIEKRDPAANRNSFASALETDRTIASIIDDAQRHETTTTADARGTSRKAKRGLFNWRRSA